MRFETTGTDRANAISEGRVVYTSTAPAVARESVAICIPCAGPVDPKFMQSIVQMALHTGRTYDGCTGVTVRTMVDDARCFLAEGALKTDAQWLFWADSDMLFPQDAIVKMIDWCKKTNAKWATGLYYQRQGKRQPLVLRRCKNYPYKDPYLAHHVCHQEGNMTPYTVDRAGMGCMLTHRSMFEALPAPWFQFIHFVDDKGVKHKVSEDFYFCTNARNAGYEMWLLPEIECGHLGEAEVVDGKYFKATLNKEIIAVDDEGLIFDEDGKALIKKQSKAVGE